MSASPSVNRLAQWVESTLARVRETAASAQRGGDERWSGLLRELGVEPLSDEERARHLAQGAPTTRGALPMEVRRALEAIQRQASPRAREIDMALEPGDDDAQRAVDRLQRRIGLLVDAELTQYMSTVRPVVSTSSIFANALATTATTMTAAGRAAGVSTTRCRCCGAPRQARREDMTCEFCGSRLDADE